MGGKKAKKDNGSGTIYYIESQGRWKAELRWIDSGGKLQRKTFSSTKKTVVKNKLEEFKKQLLLNNGNISKGSVSFEEFADNWLTTKQRNTLKPTSYMRKEVTLRNQVYPILGTIPIEEISHADVQNMVNSLSDAGLSYSTVKKAYEAVNGCLREYRIVTRLPGMFNPCEGIALPENVPLILNYIPECMADCTPENDMEFREVAALFNAFGICSLGSNCMKSDNPHSGFFETSIARTLDGNGGNPTCNQGGIAVVEPIPFTQNQRNEVRILGNQTGALSAESGSKQQTYVLQGSMIGRKNVNGPQGSGINEDVSFTLNTIDRHAVVYEEQDLRQIQTGSQKDVFGTLEANCGTKLWLGNQEAFTGDYHILEPDYAVRRLTPTECARLQGFPDWWCSNLDTPAPTETEIQFWSEVFEVHRNVVGTSSKPKSKKQIIKWLRSPHSDAAEYKMWGNGVALPCVFFVLAGIFYYAEKPQDSSISQS